MFFAIAAAATLVLFGMTLFVRQKDLPPPFVPSPTQHLEGRKAAIYENLRDLQFEYRVGKLSDDDYQRIKKELQGELSGVMAEIDRVKTPPVAEPAVKKQAATVCPHCQAKFEKALKFCGECGKAMAASA